VAAQSCLADGSGSCALGPAQASGGQISWRERYRTEQGDCSFARNCMPDQLLMCAARKAASAEAAKQGELSSSLLLSCRIQHLMAGTVAKGQRTHSYGRGHKPSRQVFCKCRGSGVTASRVPHMLGRDCAIL